ncbi:uncharacterized protein LOC114269824 [Camellia sinensis]|uniref:uncharacterized protein LOC114269824 n=1 Tax=Camellia sinensis TaxID=4442 RepID=UPI0010355F76|nr:uncharacterized protein LOC114269824 [Camellia sinensis]
MVGLDANYFREEDDYTAFIRTHLMPPLTGVRAGNAAGAPLVGETAQETKAGIRAAPPAVRAANTHTVYGGPSLASCLPSSYGAEEGDAACSAQYPGSTCTEGTCSSISSTGGTSSSGREERGRGARSRRSSELALSGDDTETNNSEEAVSRCSESESGDDDAGSGSGSRDDADAGFESRSKDDDTGSSSESDSDNGADRDSAPEDENGLLSLI